MSLLIISYSLTPTTSENIERIQPTVEHFFPAGTWVWYFLTALGWTPLTSLGKDFASSPWEHYGLLVLHVSCLYFLGYLASWWRHMLHRESAGLKWAEMRLSSITSPYTCSATLIPLSSSLCFLVLGKKCLLSDPEDPAECWGFGLNVIFLKPSSPPWCCTVRSLGHLESVIWIHKYLLHRASACQVSQTQEGLQMH